MVAKFAIPIRGSYTVGTPFGKPGSLWSSGYHTGQDFPAATGTPVIASAGGMVTFAGKSGKYGNRVEITHANGYVTTYSHLSLIDVRRFQPVTQGQRVGLVGTTGNTTGAHLHFEMKIGGRFVDPMKYMGATVPVPETPSVGDPDSGPPGGGVDVTAGGTWLRVGYFLGGAVMLILGWVSIKKGGLK